MTLVAYDEEVPIDRDEQYERQARIDQLLEQCRAKAEVNGSVTEKVLHVAVQAQAQKDSGRKAVQKRRPQGKK